MLGAQQSVCRNAIACDEDDAVVDDEVSFSFEYEYVAIEN